MNEVNSREAAGKWLALKGQAAVPEMYNWLTIALDDLFSGQAALAAVQGDAGPFIVGLEEGRLIAVTPAEETTEIKFVVRTIPLSPVTEITMTETWSEQPPNLARRRSWRFAVGKEAIEFSTEEWRKAAFSSDARPKDDELVARKIADQLGWPVPGPTPGPLA